MKLLTLLGSLILLFSCQNGKITHENSKTEEDNLQNVAFSLKDMKQKITYGESIDITWENLNNSKIDSFVLLLDNKRINSFSKDVKSWTLKADKLGRRNFIIKAFRDGKYGQSGFSIMVVSDIEPKRYSVKVLKTYPHSRESYTQGLIYHDGYFYESAGEYGHSALKKVKLENGNVEAQARVENEIFAEGIAIKGQEIYQISWKEQVCLVYNLATFEQKGRFSYEIPEGWGLEYDGKNFLMTDGSNKLYFLDPQNFAVVKTLEVMDQNGPVDMINELELVNGQLYANIYTTDEIIIIDINSGKITGKINASGLLKDSDQLPDTNVLNGIAFNPHTGNFYLTGKKWPKLFEVNFIPTK